MSGSDHSSLLNGNPAMLEIWSDAIERIEQGLPLAQVQKIVIQEWLWRAQAKRDRLNAKAQKDFLTDEQYADLAALSEMIDQLRNFI